MNDEKQMLVKAENLKKGDAVGSAVVADTRRALDGKVLITWLIDGIQTVSKYFPYVELAVVRKPVSFDAQLKETPTASDGIQTLEFCNSESGECVTVETNVPNFAPRILSRIFGSHDWQKTNAPVTRGPQITFIIH